MDFEDFLRLLPAERVYEDLLSPSLQEAGEVLHNAVKTARFILAPIDFLAAYQERLKRYIQRIAEKTKDAELIQASSQIAGKSLENLRYLPEDSPLTEMFLNLLATSIEKDKAHFAHPFFPGILANLCRDEALMLYLSKANPYYIPYGFIPPDKTDLKVYKLHYPRNRSVYLEHLVSSGLCRVERKRKFKKDPLDSSDLDHFNSREEYSLSEMGRMFIHACIRDDMDTSGFHFESESE